MSKKAYWYHVTADNDLGAEVLMEVSNTFGLAKRKRLCVTATVSRCFGAVDCSSGTWYVYRTKEKVETIKGRGECDLEVTGERWILVPTTFVLVGKIRAKNLPVQKYNVGKPGKENLRKQGAWIRRCERYFRDGKCKLRKVYKHLPTKICPMRLKNINGLCFFPECQNKLGSPAKSFTNEEGGFMCDECWERCNRWYKPKKEAS